MVYTLLFKLFFCLFSFLIKIPVYQYTTLSCTHILEIDFSV
nr:MAG TPA: hypothetical protein [Caudoviricetes sp.]